MRLTHLMAGTLAGLLALPVAGAAQARGAAGAGSDSAGQAPRPRATQRQPQAGPPARPTPPPGSVEVTEPFSQALQLAPDGSVHLFTIVGDIVVTGGEGDEVRVDAIKRAWAGSETAARAILKEMRIRVTERGGTIEVRPDGQGRPTWDGAVEYTVSLPSRAHVTIGTWWGDVRVRNVAGDLRAESVSGQIVVSGVRRVRLLKTVSGDIEMTDVEGQELAAETQAGRVTGRDLRVHTVEARSVNGAIRLTGVESVRARIGTTSGPIEFQGRFARSGHYELLSNSGDVRVTPAGAVGFDLDAGSARGRVRSEIALRPVPGQGRRDQGGSRLRGTFGDAGAALSVRTLSGDIVIAAP